MSDWMPRLDPSSPIPLYEQILEAVAVAVAVGELGPGDRLPSVRMLANRLRLNPNTTARALRALERSGLAQVERGIGMTVTEAATRIAPELSRGMLDRELTALVGTARRLRLGRKQLEEALSQVWEGDDGRETTDD